MISMQEIITFAICLSFFQTYHIYRNSGKGQMKSDFIDEIIDLPKYHHSIKTNSYESRTLP